MAEQPKTFCGVKDADIAQINTGKSSLKELMSGGLGNIEGMEIAQKKMKDGFDLLSGKSVGPVELCVCKYYDESLLEVDNDFNPIIPTNEADCTAAFGSWVCRTVENFSLQDELGKLGALTDPNAFTAMVADIKGKFGNTVPDLNDKVGAVNPALGDFFKNVKIPELPKQGDMVEQCSCSSPLYSTKEECEAAGETWTCKTVEFKGFGLPGVGDLLGGGKTSTLGDFASGIEGGASKITDFFSTAIAGADSAQVQANGAINFGANGKFQMPNLADKIPKPGELVDVYTCVGGDPLASGKEECLASGGEWRYQGKQPAPDLTNLFGASGLPKLTPENICKFCEKIEVKTELKTDPVTNEQSVEPVAKTAPEKPVVPKEPPKAPEPAPIAATDVLRKEVKAGADFNRQVLRLGITVTTLLEKRGATKEEALKIFNANFYYGHLEWAEILGETKERILTIMGGKGFMVESEAIKWKKLYLEKYSRNAPEKDVGKFEKSFVRMHRKFYARTARTDLDYDAALKAKFDIMVDKAEKQIKTDVVTTDVDATV